MSMYRSRSQPRSHKSTATEPCSLFSESPSDNYTVFDKKNKVVKALVGKPEADPTSIVSSSGVRQDRQHFQNFVDAIRTGVALNSPIFEGHRSVLLPQLGNIAQRVGRSLTCDRTNGHILQDEEAMKLWRRDYEPGWAPAV